jgi:hypothetical protein
MAEKLKKAPQVVEEEIEEVVEVEDVEVDLDDLEVGEDLEVEEVEVDEVEAELEEAAAPKKEKKEKKAGTGGLKSTEPLGEDEVGASYVAELCGVDPRELRGFLRKNYRNMDENKSQRYRWKKGDPQIQEIVDAFKAAKAGGTKKEAAPAATQAAPKATTASPAKTATPAVKTAKK